MHHNELLMMYSELFWSICHIGCKFSNKSMYLSNVKWSLVDTCLQSKGAAEGEEEEKTGTVPGTEGQCVVNDV